jgi:hypothetical protein
VKYDSEEIPNVVEAEELIRGRKRGGKRWKERKKGWEGRGIERDRKEREIEGAKRQSEQSRNTAIPSISTSLHINPNLLVSPRPLSQSS